MIDIPELCLVALVGVTGSGKSTFARRHFSPTQVLSSDAFRAMVADDENDQSASADAFDALHYVAGKRLAAGRLTVVDATNVQAHARADLVRLAREHDVLPVAIVLDLPEPLCWERTHARPDRTFGRPVVQRQHRDLRRSLRGLGREGFRKVHVLGTVDEVAAAEVRYEKLYNDRRDLAGPFDIIGDVHGCRGELVELLRRLGWRLLPDGTGASHPLGRTAVFLGDLVDRGPDTPGVLRLVMGMVASGDALCVAGNHEAKLLRKLRGRQVRMAHGIVETMAQLATQEPAFVDSVATFLDRLISHYVLDGGRLVVAHAGLKEAYHGRASGRVRSFALYGDTTGETDEYGLPVRYPWADDYRGSATVVYGHTPVPEAEWVNNTLCLDTGAVFGGSLTALRYPERELVSVPARETYYEPVRPLRTEGSTRDSAALDVADVTGRRHIETRYGRVTVPAENAAAALEVMGRFAIDPRWLLWLPPTMAPASTSTVDGYLEHPAEAFEDYRAAGVRRVVCEEKHMGSRAMVLLCRDGSVAARRFGVTGGPGTTGEPAAGAVYTRTGRPFFPDGEVAGELLDRVRQAATRAELWSDLDTGWLLLDCELLPWSAKADGLIREQYASVAAAAGAALPAALAAVSAAQARGLDLADLHERLSARAANVRAFTDAYRGYVWPTEGLSGVRLAPFAVLASGGASHAGRDRDWHLSRCDRLAAADPGLIAPTDRVPVHLDQAQEVARATQWWLARTAAGAEGMVVKPHQPDPDPRVPPGIKCRGREYLRLIYGPDYTAPAHLDRLRGRNLGHKRRMARQEHGLGLAALERLAAREPLWRVHELVFAVLAVESEPVDPRL
jgi:polynucleotide kinase-phosphatase